MKRWLALAVGASLGLAGCGGESHQDLRAWMAEQGKAQKGKLEPLPQMKPYEPFTYNAFDLRTRSSRARSSRPRAAASSPPTSPAAREPLESFPLESLAMVGRWRRTHDVSR